jgi:diguanylate cyclase (GGDEF)-like protein
MTLSPTHMPTRPSRTSLYREATGLAIALRWVLLVVGAVWLYPYTGFRVPAGWLLGAVALYNGLLTLLYWSRNNPPLIVVSALDLIGLTALLALYIAPHPDAVFLYVLLIVTLTLAYGWRGVALSLGGYLIGEFAVWYMTVPGAGLGWSALLRVGAVALGALILGRVVERHEALRLRLSRAGATEGDGGLYDLQAFAKALENLHKLAIRGAWPYSVLVIDITKPGSSGGYRQPRIDDELLNHLATETRTELRSTDLVGRVGADVFGVALPDTGQMGAENVARRVEDRLRELAPDLTIAVGLSSIEPTRQDNYDKCLHAAFAAAREVKGGSDGRDKV